MMKKFLLIFSLIFVLPVASLAEELTVAVAANLQYTFTELKSAFEADSGIVIKEIIGSSGKFISQIENGAPFDLFLSADMDYPMTLYKKGLAYHAPEIYVYGTLVLWTLKDLDLSRGIEVLRDPSIQKIAIPIPKTAPYGWQAINALNHFKLYDEVSEKLVYGESIAQTNQFITTMASDIGFTAKSVVLAENMKDKGKWIEIETQAYDPIAPGVVILKHAPDHLPAAQKFYDFLFSKQARDIYQKYGYILP